MSTCCSSRSGRRFTRSAHSCRAWSLAIAILIAGWLVAKAVRFALVKTLRAINFNVITEKAGIDAFLRQGGGDIDTIRVLGALAYWLVILAALMIAFNSLDLAYVTDLVGRVVLFVPRVMVAVVILVFGAYFARFVVGRADRLSARTSAQARRRCSAACRCTRSWRSSS